ncbi:hypothetical protein [Streptomyces sp. NBC_00829]|uniref:hypothetical protein n=1 Tax=Streptomyces sp. NBC_00829 TaxID=2903679 RepID=UPI00386AE4C5|nr:hypothetical protein OG293_31185 [Streptomyces sp. NBC_00829]
MQRTKISAKLLLGMTAWAVCGCVAVEPPPAPPAPSGRQAGVVEPRIVQSPAREALGATAADETTPASTPAAGDGRRQRPKARPVRPERGREPSTGQLPPVPVVPAVPPDVCALAEQYGRWRPGSPEARICREAYRRGRRH